MRGTIAYVTALASCGLAAAACRDKRPERPVPAGSAEPAIAAPAEAAPAPVEDAAAEAEDVVDAGGATGGALSSSFVHRDVNHVLATGQSLSVGAVGYPPLSRTQPYGNLMFSTGVIAGSTNLTRFVPLVEGAVPGGSTPDDETMSSAFANLVTKMAVTEVLASRPPGERRHDVLVSVHGVGGTPYSGLAKGTPPFAAGMAQVKAALRIAGSLGRSYVVRVVTNVHGESDHQLSNDHYARDLATWQSDYESGVKALTGQSEPVPMLHTQVSSWTRYGQATSAIPGAQLRASVESKGKIVLVGPKYHLPYVKDGIHLTNEGYRHMGEDHAKVYRRAVLEGKSWEPLRPLHVARDGATITVRFHVPVPPLVIDDALVSDPGARGFELIQSGARPPRITSVAVTGPDTVTITLSAEPTGSGRRLRYAFTGRPGAPAGPRTGPRGNLRDSDATRSRFGYRLYNWCVHFDEPVP